MAFNRSAAVNYARRWALSTNPSYPRFPNDCTNFISQAMLAGGWSMVGEHSVTNRKGNNVWWYGGSNFTRASYTWAGAQNIANFLAASRRGTQVSDESQLGLADVIQLKDKGGHIYHTMIVTKKTGTDLLLSYHTSDHLDEPLSAIRGRLQAEHQFVYWRISDSRT